MSVRPSPEVERSLGAHRAALRVAAAVGRRNLRRMLAAGLPEWLAPPLGFLLDRRLDARTLAVVATVEAIREEIAARGDEPLAVFVDPRRPVDPVRLTAAWAARTAGVRPLFGAFLHLAAAARGARDVLELGGGVGISGCYLATAPGVRRFVTIEGSPERAALAARHLARVAPHATVLTGPFAERLDAALARFDDGLDLLFLDGPKRCDQELALLERLLPRLRRGALVVCDDVHWSREMELAWREVARRQGFEWAIDVGRMGVAVWRGGDVRARAVRLFGVAGIDPFRVRRVLTGGGDGGPPAAPGRPMPPAAVAAEAARGEGGAVAGSRLSVVLATRGSFATTVSRTVEHLRRQTLRGEIELVLVTPSSERLALDDAVVAGFAGHRVVEVGELRSVGHANAAGVREATAPIVALVEDHCFPEPEWAERLLAAWEGPWAAVGAAVRNANPDTTISWADLLIAYGPWLAPAVSREADFLPGHNSSYRRELLLGFGDRLEGLMQAETVLHWELRALGHRLYLEAGAVVAHTNFSCWRPWLTAHRLHGRVFAAKRSEPWPRWRRLVFTLGSPLIPAVRLARIARGLPSAAVRRRFVAALPALAVGLASDALGQALGYAFGAGDAGDRLLAYEIERWRYVRPAESWQRAEA